MCLFFKKKTHLSNGKVYVLAHFSVFILISITFGGILVAFSEVLAKS